MRSRSLFATLFLILACSMLVQAQIAVVAPQSAAQSNSIPRLVKFSGALRDANGNVVTGTSNVAFAVYAASEGGAPLWQETQSVTVDGAGKYNVLLGANSPDGITQDVFSSGEARWLGVQVEGVAEQPRTLLVSVPYALKASDADTLGGKPLSAFVLASPDLATSAASTNPTPKLGVAPTRSSWISPSCASGVGCTTPASTLGDIGNQLAKFSGIPGELINSTIFDNGNVGIGTSTPGAKLDVNGNILFSVAPGKAGFAGFNVAGDGVFRAGINMPNLLGEGATSKQGAFFTMDTRASQNVLAIFTKPANSSVETERVTIQAGGNVGIGTTSPTQKLDVGGNAAINGSLLMTSSPLNAGFRGFNLSPDGVLRMGINSPNMLGEVDSTRQGAFFTMDTRGSQSALAVFTKPPGSSVETERFTVQSSGNVGINNPAPTTALDVIGTVRATGGIRFADGSVQTTAATASGGSTSYSNASLNGRYAFSVFGAFPSNGGVFVFTDIGTIQVDGNGHITSGSLTEVSSGFSGSCQVNVTGTYSVSSGGQGTAAISVTAISGACGSGNLTFTIQVAQQGGSFLFAEADTGGWSSGTGIRQ